MATTKKLLIVLLLCFTASCGFRSGPLHLQKAEEYSRQGQIELAIASYQMHISERLSAETRAEWENPYFYNLLIGDLYLRQNRLEEALSAYEEAESKGIDMQLVADRYRFAAAYLEGKSEYQKALEILSKYRDRDPLLFDLVSDRVARKAVATADTDSTQD